jgi:hypothetical protein
MTVSRVAQDSLERVSRLVVEVSRESRDSLETLSRQSRDSLERVSRFFGHDLETLEKLFGIVQTFHVLINDKMQTHDMNTSHATHRTNCATFASVETFPGASLNGW